MVDLKSEGPRFKFRFMHSATHLVRLLSVVPSSAPGGWGDGGRFYMKGAGMLVGNFELNP